MVQINVNEWIKQFNTKIQSIFEFTKSIEINVETGNVFKKIINKNE